MAIILSTSLTYHLAPKSKAPHTEPLARCNEGKPRWELI